MYKKEIAFALMAFTLWTLSDAIIRGLNSYPSEFIAFMGGTISVLLLCIAAPRLGGLKQTLTMPQLRLRLLRGFVLACSGIAAVFTFTRLDLATAYTFIFVAPFSGKMLSALLNKEVISLRSWGITALGFLGVIIALRPTEIAFNIGIAAALLSATLFALGYVLTRYIRRENQTALSMVLFQYCFMIVLTAPAALAFITQTQPDTFPGISFVHALLFITISVLGIAGSGLAAMAFAGAPAAIISPLHYTQIIWGALFGALFFDEYPNQWTVIGAVIIVGAGLLLMRQQKEQTDTQKAG